MGTRIWAFGPLALPGAIAFGFLALAACDGAPSATAARSHAASADRRLADTAPEGGETRAPARYSAAAYTSGDPARSEAATPLFHGKPIWASNKRHTAQENADYQYKRDGEALGATSEDDFLTKVHAFVDSPPKGAQTLTRANGDVLMFDPKSGLFAVADKDGAPRTLFKPKDGAAYWDKQKDALAQGDDDTPRPKRKSARRSGGDDNG